MCDLRVNITFPATIENTESPLAEENENFDQLENEVNPKHL
jgi:hypothetical protein